MCGRYNLAVNLEQLQLQFGTGLPANALPRYNVAPSQACPVIRVDAGQRIWAVLRWGLIPHWAKSTAVGFSNINARAESLATKPTFRQAYQRRRCLVPATGFYEWRTLAESRQKQPYNVRLKNRAVFTLAGIWERWRDIASFAIVTTAANELLCAIHERMPVIIEPAAHDVWLSGPVTEADALLRPHPSEAMEAYPVGTLVNKADNESPACLVAIREDARKQLRLFGVDPF